MRSFPPPPPPPPPLPPVSEPEDQKVAKHDEDEVRALLDNIPESDLDLSFTDLVEINRKDDEGESGGGGKDSKEELSEAAAANSRDDNDGENPHTTVGRRGHRVRRRRRKSISTDSNYQVVGGSERQSSVKLAGGGRGRRQSTDGVLLNVYVPIFSTRSRVSIAGSDKYSSSMKLSTNSSSRSFDERSATSTTTSGSANRWTWRLWCCLSAIWPQKSSRGGRRSIPIPH